MKYYVVEIAEGDSKITGKSIYEYSTYREAEASYHQKLATAMNSELFTSDLVFMINSNGGIHMIRKYVADASIEVTE